jgi:hypothetical protein
MIGALLISLVFSFYKLKARTFCRPKTKTETLLVPNIAGSARERLVGKISFQPVFDNTKFPITIVI